MKVIFKNVFLFGIIAGALVSAVCWIFLFLLNETINFIWDTLPAILHVNTVLWILLMFSVGGICISWAQKSFGKYPKEMHQIISELKENGRLDYNDMHKYSLCALLPLIFGASLGPEAGIFGIACMLSIMIYENYSKILRKSTLTNDNQEFEEKELFEVAAETAMTAVFRVPIFNLLGHKQVGYSHSQKLSHAKKIINITTYITAIITSIFVVYALNSFFHKHGLLSVLSIGFRRYHGSIWTAIVSPLPLFLIAVVFGIIFIYFDKLLSNIIAKLNIKSFLLPLIGGIIVAILAIINKDVMFSGEQSIEHLRENYSQISIYLLIFSGILKIIATTFCLRFNWVGGKIFPILYASMSISYGISLLTGVDAAIVIAVVGTGIMTALLRKPLGVIILLFTFSTFSIFSLLLMILASLGVEKIARFLEQKKLLPSELIS
jgi:H+/Cl- antiporter ClcA